MRHSKTLIFSLLLAQLLSLSTAWPQDRAIELFYWQPHPDQPRYLLPQRPNETRAEAVQNFLNSVKQSPELKRFSVEIKEDSKPESQPMVHDLTPNQDHVLFVGNSEKDHQDESPRVTKFMNQLPQTENYVLPIGAALRLSPEERETFYSQISLKFSGLVLMGGDDVDPIHYEDELTHARKTNSLRDTLEIELIRTYVKAEKGFVFGVCRGHQITSVALGYKLIQDLQTVERPTIPHENHDHEVYIVPGGSQILKSIINKWKDSAAWFRAYSWHHQAVVFHEGGPLRLAAISPEGITEALDF